MDSDKLILMRAFNKLFFEFLDDIISIYPDNVDMLIGRESFITVKKINPTGIIKVWFSSVYGKYKTQIDSCDIEFFAEKDYSQDLLKVQNTHNILEMINSIRDPIKNMDAKSKEHVAKYVQDLSKLSVAYASLNL